MSGSVAVERDTSGPHELIVLDNGVLRLTCAPALGGRLLSARHRGSEFLYRNPRLLGPDLHPVEGVSLEPVEGPMSEWNNVGGDKTWPAPQGWDGPDQWAGPPDPVLDSGSYTAEVETRGDGAAVLTLTSGDDPRSGLRLRRRLTLNPDSAAYQLDLSALNTGGVPRRWALWNVTQLSGEPVEGQGAQGVYVGVDGPGPATAPLVRGDAHPEVVEHVPGVLRVPAQDVVGKVGFPTAAGWLANVGAGGTATQRFAVRENEPYPDGGSRVQVWLEYPLGRPLEHLGGLCPVDRVVECEALGPLTELAPGESAALTVECGFGAGTGPVAEVTPDGFWSTPPRWSGHESTGRRVSGTFTAYHPGTLRYRPGAGGGTLGPDEGSERGPVLATVRPGEPFDLDAAVPGSAQDTHGVPGVVFIKARP